MLDIFREQFERTIPGRLLMELGGRCNPEEVLVFGCGQGSLPIITARYFTEASVTAYDVDEEKIEAMCADPRKCYEKVFYTTINPIQEFDVLLAMAVLHEDPTPLTSAVASFTKPGGYVGVIDYDMVGMPMEEFLSRWGCNESEKAELERLGEEEVYKMHTIFGLDNCIALMEGAGICCEFSQGGIPTDSGTIHFIYLGQKPLS